MSFNFIDMLLIQNLCFVFARRGPETSGCLPAGLFRVNSCIAFLLFFIDFNEYLYNIAILFIIRGVAKIIYSMSDVIKIDFSIEYVSIHLHVIPVKTGIHHFVYI